MSKYPLLLSCLGFGLAGGLIGGLLLSGGSEPQLPPSDPAQAAATAKPDPRMDELIGDVQGLASRMTVMEGQLQGMARESARPVAPSEAASQTEPGQLFASLDEDPQISALLDQRVQAVLDARDEQQRQERQARDAQMREQFMTQRVERLAQELQLNDFQKSEMDRILRSEDQKRTDFFQKMRDTGEYDREQISNSFREMREQTESELSVVLTPDQLSKYKETNSNGPFWNGRMFGDGGGPPGGNGDRGGRGNG